MARKTRTALTCAAVAMVIVLFTSASLHAAIVSYWSFDTDASDALGAHDGTLLNGASISSGNAGYGGGEALSLIGGSGTSASHVTTANPTAFNFNTDFTWHAYVKTSSGAGGIFGRAPATPVIHNQGSKSLFISGNNVRFDAGWVGMPNTGTSVNDNQWHQIIATYVASTDQLDVFVDPAIGATTGNYSNTFNVNAYNEHTHLHNGGYAATSFRIGNISDNFQNSAINGLIDEAAVFDTALTGTALNQLIATGPTSFVNSNGTVTAAPLPNDESAIVNTGGTVISAANFGSEAGGNSTVDINGIVHPVASAANNGTGADLIPGLTINSTFDGNYRSGQSGTAGYTGDMLDLMGGIAGNGSPGPLSLEISGLTVGEDYLFQGYWEANNFGQTAMVTFEGVDTLGGITGANGLGSLISYSFTASDTILNADLFKTGGSDNIWWLGYSLQEASAAAVPEPSTFALAALGLLGLGWFTRRRKR